MDFLTIWWKAPFWLVENLKKKWKFSGRRVGRARAGTMHGHHKYFVDPRPPRKSENTACMYVQEHWFTHSNPQYDLWWP